MEFDYYGMTVIVVSVACLYLVTRLKRKLVGIPETGWNKIFVALACFLFAGVLQLVSNVDSLMNLLVPAAVNWLSVAAKLAIAAGVGSFAWGLAGIVGSARQIQVQEGDDEEWRALYLQLQELSMQPFSFVEILNLAVNQILKKSGAEGAAVFLYKENTAELILAAFSNLPPEMTKRLERLKTGGDIFGRTQKLGRIQNVVNLSDCDKSTEELFASSGFLSAAVYPLRSRDKVLGSFALFSTTPYFFTPKRSTAITVATNHLATVLEMVREEKEVTRLRDRLKPSEEAKRITEELFFRRGMGSNLELREAVEFERVRKFFDADCIKLVFRDKDGEYRIKASSGGAETGLILDKRKLTGISRAVSERKLLLLTSPSSTPAGQGYDSMPRQTLFIPVPYPEREDLVLLLESETASLEFSEEKLSAVRVASVYLADLHFLFLAKREGDRYRNSIANVEQSIRKLMHANSSHQTSAAIAESCSLVLPNCKARLTILGRKGDPPSQKIVDTSGLNIGTDVSLLQHDHVLDVLKEFVTPQFEQASRITKTALLEKFVPATRERVAQLLLPLPNVLQFVVLPVRRDDVELGISALFFVEDDPASNEAIELYHRLLDVATINLTAEQITVNPAKKAKNQDRGEMNNDSAAMKRLGGEEASEISWRADFDSNIDLSTLAASNNSGMLNTIEVLVKNLFAAQGKLFFSYLEDGRHTYHQISTSEHETKLFRQHRLENHDWEPCPFAVNMPDAFRALAGEYNSRTEEGKLISLTWRLPHSLEPVEKPRKMNILGIDDQEVIRELLSSIITRMGHRIAIVADGSEGMRLFKESHFDLVIVEADLPGVNGWDIAQQIKSLSPSTPVIMLSGWGLESEGEALLKRSADFVLAKPFKMEQLGRIIGAACDMITV